VRLEDLRVGDGALVIVGLYRFNQFRHVAQRSDYSLVALIDRTRLGAEFPHLELHPQAWICEVELVGPRRSASILFEHAF
jgi:hypothetical protein